MNAQNLMTTSVVGLATDSRIRHASNHRNLSAIEAYPIASLTLADTIGPDRRRSAAAALAQVSVRGARVGPERT
jgi:hypothetical protein